MADPKKWPRLILTKKDRELRLLLAQLDEASERLVRLITMAEFRNVTRPECTALIVEMCNKVMRVQRPVDFFGFRYVGMKTEPYFVTGTLTNGSHDIIRQCCTSEAVLAIVDEMAAIDAKIQANVL